MARSKKNRFFSLLTPKKGKDKYGKYPFESFSDMKRREKWIRENLT